jgi:fimbrial chaperone protein
MRVLRTSVLWLVLAATAAPAIAGDFGVSPIRIDLDRSTRSSVITVTNDDQRTLSFQVRVMEWSQDDSGRDQYTESSDLVYFPQQLQVPAKERRVVRVGYRVPAVQAEKTYRLFIEELADEATRSLTQTGVAIVLRFGVPVFLRPVTENERGELELSVGGGAARALVRNTGNVHFRLKDVRIEGIGAAGQSTFETTVYGWYLLTGAERLHEAVIPPEACAATQRVRVEALSEKLALRAEQPLAPDACR